MPDSTSPLTQALIDRAVLACRSGEYARGYLLLEEAVIAYGSAQALAPRPLAWYGLAMALTSQNRIEEAVQWCEEAARHEPDDAEICYVLGRVYLLAGWRGKAVSCLHNGLRLDPENAELKPLQQLLGVRSPPVLRFLHRRHPVNVLLGRLRYLLSARD